jgi:hypothetical protein
MFTRTIALASAAAATMGGSFGGLFTRQAREHHKGRTMRPSGYRTRPGRYLPHQSDREIARRLRQQERDKANQLARAQLWRGIGAKPGVGLSRRGKPVSL